MSNEDENMIKAFYSRVDSESALSPIFKSNLFYRGKKNPEDKIRFFLLIVIRGRQKLSLKVTRVRFRCLEALR